jgi:hypothetical protein
MAPDPYAFVFRGLLAEEALDKTDRMSRVSLAGQVDGDVVARLPLDLLDQQLLARARRMAAVYVAIAAFENTVREFVARRLLELVGPDWWTSAVSEKIRTRAETRRQEELKVRWHTPRGDAPINYTEFGDLASILNQNWQHFQDVLESQDWARHIIGTLERSRNVIMHSADLGQEDVERIGSAIRDWIRQVGA